MTRITHVSELFCFKLLWLRLSMFQNYYALGRMDGAVKNKAVFDNIGLNAGESEPVETYRKPVKGRTVKFNNGSD